jgi:hypothetical protein
VYDQSRGEWITAKADFLGDCRKVLASLFNKEAIIILSAFLLAWQILFMAFSHNPVPAKIVCHKGFLYSVVGKGKTKGTSRAFPAGGGTAVDIPKQKYEAI